MADTTQNQATDQLNTLSSKSDQLWNLFTYGAKSYIDKETHKDSNNMPDKVDLTYGNHAPSSNMNGSQPQNTPGGMSGKAVALMVGGVIVGLIVLKKAKVF